MRSGTRMAKPMAAVDDDDKGQGQGQGQGQGVYLRKTIVEYISHEFVRGDTERERAALRPNLSEKQQL